jgi:hypothetical protein
MAIFNNPLPANEAPSFLGYSKGISQPEGNKAFGIALEGIAKAAESAITAADANTKRTIDAAVDSGTESINTDTIRALETKAGISPDRRVTQGDGDLSLLNKGNEADVPSEVADDTEAAVQRDGALSGARSSGSHAPIYHDARKEMLRKDLRSKYPGYVDYIDAKMGNTANAYMSDLMRQINANQSAATKQLTSDISLVNAEVKDKNPDAIRAMQKVQSGQWSSQNGLLTQWLVNTRSLKARVEEAEQQVKLMQSGSSFEKDAAQKQAPYIINEMVKSAEFNMLDGQTGTLKDAVEFMGKLARGEKTISDTDAVQMTKILKAWMAETYGNIDQKLNTPLAFGKNSIAQILQPDEVKKQITSGMERIKQVVDAFEDKQYGLAHTLADRMQAMTDTGSYRLATSLEPDVRNGTLGLSIINRMGGPNAAERYFGTIITNSEDKAIVNAVKQTAATIGAQQGEITSLGEAFRRGKAAGLGSAPGEAGKAQTAYYKDVLNIPNKITDQEIATSIRENIIKGSYGPGNEDLLDQIKNDFTDKHGNVIPGRNKVFQDMTSADKTAEIFKMSQSKPELWKNYTSWAETGFNKLFGQNVRELGSIFENQSKTPRIKVTYNSQENKFILNYDIPENAYYAGVKYKAELDRLTEQVNNGVKSMANIAKASGADPEAYILTNLNAANPKTDFNNRTNPDEEMKNSTTYKVLTGIHDMFKQAIINAKLPIQKYDDK